MTADTQTTFNIIMRHLEQGTKFDFLRYGDGQFFTMMGKQDGEHRNSKELAKALKSALMIKSQDYMVGIPLYENEPGMQEANLAQMKGAEKFEDVLDFYPSRQYYNFITLHYYSIYHQVEFKKFIDLLKTKKLLVIGGPHLRPIADNLGARFIETPSTQAFYRMDEFLQKIIETEQDDVEVVLLGCGMCSSVLQALLYGMRRWSTIDVGSVFDAMLGINTRGWIGASQDKIKNLTKIIYE